MVKYKYSRAEKNNLWSTDNLNPNLFVVEGLGQMVSMLDLLLGDHWFEPRQYHL